MKYTFCDKCGRPTSGVSDSGAVFVPVTKLRQIGKMVNVDGLYALVRDALAEIAWIRITAV